jgi:hypothetical protein
MWHLGEMQTFMRNHMDPDNDHLFSRSGLRKRSG